MFTQARATAVAASRSTDPRLSASRKARNGVRKARDQRVSPENSSRCVGIAWKYPANADGPPAETDSRRGSTPDPIRPYGAGAVEAPSLRPVDYVSGLCCTSCSADSESIGAGRGDVGRPARLTAHLTLG